MSQINRTARPSRRRSPVRTGFWSHFGTLAEPYDTINRAKTGDFPVQSKPVLSKINLEFRHPAKYRLTKRSPSCVFHER